jgi:hypothetical protein
MCVKWWKHGQSPQPDPRIFSAQFYVLTWLDYCVASYLAKPYSGVVGETHPWLISLLIQRQSNQEDQRQRGRGLFWLLVSEDSVHGHLALLLGICGETKAYGRCIWKRRMLTSLWPGSNEEKKEPNLEKRECDFHEPLTGTCQQPNFLPLGQSPKSPKMSTIFQKCFHLGTVFVCFFFQHQSLWGKHLIFKHNSIWIFMTNEAV